MAANQFTFKPAIFVAPGETFGRLTVIRELPRVQTGYGKRRRVECLCECGKTTSVEPKSLRNGNTQSCGCGMNEINRSNQFTKGFSDAVSLFMSRVQKQEGGCWLWTGFLENGYGRFTIKGAPVRMPRAAWLVLRGPIPEGLEPDHLCRVRACVNPDHMELVTHQVNVQRGEAGKHLSSRTHCPHGHPYSGENLIIRKSGARRCRECSRASDRQRRALRRIPLRETHRQ